MNYTIHSKHGRTSDRHNLNDAQALADRLHSDWPQSRPYTVIDNNTHTTVYTAGPAPLYTLHYDSTDRMIAWHTTGLPDLGEAETLARKYAVDHRQTIIVRDQHGTDVYIAAPNFDTTRDIHVDSLTILAALIAAGGHPADDRLIKISISLAKRLDIMLSSDNQSPKGIK